MTDIISRADAICEVLVNDGIDNIVDRINSIAGEYPPETVFQDWVKCMAISWQNSFAFIHDKVWEERMGKWRAKNMK